MADLRVCKCPLEEVCSRSEGPFREARRGRYNIIYLQGEPATQIYFVQRGTVSLHRMSSEERALGRTRALRHAGSFIGIEGLIDPNYRDSARAETDLLLCAASRERVADWVHQEQVCWQVLRNVLQTEDEELLPLAAPDGTALQRVASWILDGNQSERSDNIQRKVIADLLGMRPETMSRALHTLEREGLVEVSRRSLLIVDPEGLRRKLLPTPPRPS